MTDRPATSTSSGELAFSGVVLEARSGDRTPAVEDIGLVVDERGLTVTGPAPSATRLVSWPELADVVAGEPATLPDGAPAVGLAGTVGSRRVRWLIPARQLPPERRAALDRMLEPHGGPTVLEPAAPPTGVPPPPPPSAVLPPPPNAWPPPPPPPPTLWSGPAASPPSRRHKQRHVGRWVVLAVVVVLLVGAGVGALFAWSAKSPSASGPASGSSGDLEVAQQINITVGDIPSTWSVDSSPSGPLGAFFSSRGAAPSLSPSQRHEVAQVAAGYEQCMGIPAASDRIFGGATSTPTAEANSPVFAAPTAGPISETGSQTEVFASSENVAADVAQVSSPRFPLCFGAALGKEFLEGAQGANGGVTLGTPQVQPLSLPQTPGVHAVGIDLTIPITSAAGTVPTQFGFVLTGGGRVEATLITFAAATAFAPSLTTGLTTALEHNIATRGTSTGA